MSAQKRMTGEERRKQIIDIAVDLFSKRGFAEVTTREIAAGAGINEATIYKHFESKEALYDAVLEYYSDRALAVFDSVQIDSKTDFRAAMSDLAHRAFGFMEQDPRIFRLMIYSGLHDDEFSENYFGRVGMKVLKTIQRAISIGSEKGTIRKDVDPLYTSITLMGMVIYYNIARFIVLRKFFKDLEDEKYIEHILKIAIEGLRP